MDAMKKTATASITMPDPDEVVFVDPFAGDLYWDGVRWSMFRPDTKITFVDAEDESPNSPLKPVI